MMRVMLEADLTSTMSALPSLPLPSELNLNDMCDSARDQIHDYTSKPTCDSSHFRHYKKSGLTTNDEPAYFPLD